MNWYLAVLKKYAVFNGRARRKEYWLFTLFNAIIGFCFGFAAGVMGAGGDSVFAPIVLVYAVAVMIPGLAVTVRRLHDTDRSGWWFWSALIPFVGAFILLYFMVQEGTRGNNQYGPDPKDPIGPAQFREPQRTANPVA